MIGNEDRAASACVKGLHSRTDCSACTGSGSLIDLYPELAALAALAAVTDVLEEETPEAEELLLSEDAAEGEAPEEEADPEGGLPDEELPPEEDPTAPEEPEFPPEEDPDGPPEGDDGDLTDPVSPEEDPAAPEDDPLATADDLAGDMPSADPEDGSVPQDPDVSAEAEGPIAPEVSQDSLSPETPPDRPLPPEIVVPVEAEAVPVPLEELPPEEVSIDAYNAFSLTLLHMVATELIQLDETQRETILGIWTENNFAYDPVSDMLTTYQAAGLGDQASLAVMAANLQSCAAYIKAEFSGDSRYLEAFCETMDAAYQEVAALDTYEFFAEGVQERLTEIITDCYQAVRAIEREEQEETGESELIRLFNAYRYDRGKHDAVMLFRLAAEFIA